MSFSEADNKAHQDRVKLLLERVLKILALAEDDPLIFPAPATDPDDRAKEIALLNSDTLGNVLGTQYLACRRLYGNEGAKQWLAELMSIFVGLVRRDAPEDGLDFEELQAIYKNMDTPTVPDALPEDFDE